MPVDPDAAEAIRAWVRGLSREYSPLAYPAVYQAMTASFFRIHRFGVEDGLDAYTARELLHFTLMLKDDLEQWLRHAYSRAVLEDDREIIALYAPLPIARDFQAWFHALDGADEAGARAAVAAPPDSREELLMRRLVCARRWPRLIEAAWLDADDGVAERITYRVLRVIADARHDLHDAALAFLAGAPRCLVAGEPDDVLAPMVSASQRPPQHVLKPLDGWYDERTVLAAAGWHLEHREPQAALALAAAFRPLGAHAERAWLVCALACLDLHRAEESRAWRDRIADPALRAQVDIAVLERDPRDSAAIAAAELANACSATQPELFYRCVRLLLSRRDLTRARDACARRRDDFIGHPVVGAMIDEILKPRGAASAPPAR